MIDSCEAFEEIKKYMIIVHINIIPGDQAQVSDHVEGRKMHRIYIIKKSLTSLL